MPFKAKNLITKIHVAKSQLGLTDDAYRAILGRYGVSSSKELRGPQLLRLLEHFRTLGWQDAPRKRRPNDTHGEPQNPAVYRQALMDKIEAQLAEMGSQQDGHVPWSYAAAILLRQGGPDRLEWATPEQLKGIIAALYKDAKRRGRATK